MNQFVDLPSRILTLDEIRQVLDHWTRKRRYTANRQLLAIFRLSCCCGLRVGEIIQLPLSAMHLDAAKPCLKLPATICKGGRGRSVPLWWDRATLEALRAWRDEQSERIGPSGLVVSCQSRDALGRPLDRWAARRVWKRAVGILPDRKRSSIHDGRHTMASIALHGGRTLVEVRDALGHASIATTNLYLQVPHDDGTVGDLFA